MFRKQYKKSSNKTISKKYDKKYCLFLTWHLTKWGATWFSVKARPGDERLGLFETLIRPSILFACWCSFHHALQIVIRRIRFPLVVQRLRKSVQTDFHWSSSPSMWWGRRKVMWLVSFVVFCCCFPLILVNKIPPSSHLRYEKDSKKRGRDKKEFRKLEFERRETIQYISKPKSSGDLSVLVKAFLKLLICFTSIIYPCSFLLIILSIYPCYGSLFEIWFGDFFCWIWRVYKILMVDYILLWRGTRSYFNFLLMILTYSLFNLIVLM